MTIGIGGAFFNSDHFGNIKVHSNPEERLNKYCAGIAIRVKGALLPSDSGVDNWALIKSLNVMGSGKRQVVCQITSTDPPAQNEYLAPLAAAVLANTNVPYPRFAPTEHIGEATEIEALRRARQILQAGLDMASRKTWVIKADIPTTLPERGDTVSVNGRLCVLDDWELNIADNGAETLTLYTIDYSPPTGELLY